MFGLNFIFFPQFAFGFCFANTVQVNVFNHSFTVIQHNKQLTILNTAIIHIPLAAFFGGGYDGWRLIGNHINIFDLKTLIFKGSYLTFSGYTAKIYLAWAF